MPRSSWARVYAANTVGAILRAIVWSIVLIPAVGSRDAQRVLIALSVVGAVVPLLSQRTLAEPERGMPPRADEEPEYAPGMFSLALAPVLALGLMVTMPE